MSLRERIARDVRFYRRLFDVTRGGWPKDRGSSYTTADLIAEVVGKRPGAVAIRMDATEMTYAELDARSNRYAHWARGLGLGPHTTVGLMMENRPEYFAAWMGMAKAGVTTALLNTSISGEALAHCLRIAGAQHLLLGAELGHVARGLAAIAGESVRIWTEGGHVEDVPPLDYALAEASDGPVEATARAGLVGTDPLFYIYTSGTTGLPKAVKISHYRFGGGSRALRIVTGVQKGGRLYCPLPLYHSTGLMAAWGALRHEAGLILRRRFSASHFWEDCVTHRATAFIYIGEIMRYLVNAPESPFERRHEIASCGGNGLRPDVWEAFIRRFGITDIIEFYAATESNLIIFNFDGKPGAIGRAPKLVRKRLNIDLVRFDPETERPVRGADGFCIPCKPGEVGEALGEIKQDPSKQKMPFEGYTSKAETEKKILTDVFVKGDRYFRTGDLMRYDEHGYFYFVDRIGDTFRWKGENVSTAEVQDVLSRAPGVELAIVYGVHVPNADGRAGMAAIKAGEDFDPGRLAAHVDAHLPAYARPIFVRLIEDADTTGTFKFKKADLVREGFDPRITGARTYVRTGTAPGGYAPLGLEEFERVCAGEVRL